MNPYLIDFMPADEHTHQRIKRLATAQKALENCVYTLIYNFEKLRISSEELEIVIPAGGLEDLMGQMDTAQQEILRCYDELNKAGLITYVEPSEYEN